MRVLTKALGRAPEQATASQLSSGMAGQSCSALDPDIDESFSANLAAEAGALARCSGELDLLPRWAMTLVHVYLFVASVYTKICNTAATVYKHDEV
jgi:hypothetical protein